VTHVEGFADGDDEGDVWVKIDGLAREYVFGLYQLEVLPLAGASRQCSTAAPLSDQSEVPESVPQGVQELPFGLAVDQAGVPQRAPGCRNRRGQGERHLPGPGPGNHQGPTRPGPGMAKFTSPFRRPASPRASRGSSGSMIHPPER
jgi:hypothetical protein